MEIKLNGITYCINPRRIVYIEHFIASESYPYYNKETFSPDTPQSELDKYLKNSDILRFKKFIKIIMTDKEEIFFGVDDDDNYYNELKKSLERIVGGWSKESM